MPAVHVRGGARDVAQARHPERAALAGVSRDRLGSRVNELPRRIGHAQYSQLLVGKQRWCMALRATGNKRTEHIEPGDFIFVECRMIAVRIQIVAAVQRDQRTFKSRDGGIDLVEGDGCFPKGLRK